VEVSTLKKPSFYRQSTKGWDGRVAEWFKAPVLKFAFPRFVQSRHIWRDVSSSTMAGLFITAGVGVVWLVSGRW
jgi:hypothetical protein